MTSGYGFGSVCAVVVTHNRKELLSECLTALAHQSCPLAEILVVDNASTDGTEQLVRGDYPSVTYLRLAQNTGGSGGFHLGIRKAHARGHDWIWVLDDDAIAAPDCLEELVSAWHRFADQSKPMLLASKVVWRDGTLHPMCAPWVKTSNMAQLVCSVERGAVPIRSTSFVSMLFRASLVERYGLPVANYYIWNDDIEYTARILRHELGVLVPTSSIWHKTASKYTPVESGPRYYYEVRNKIWMLTRSNAWSGRERLSIALRLLISTGRYLLGSRFPGGAWTVLRGVVDAVFTRPLSEGA